MLTQQGFPQISAPFLDQKTGIINQTWLQLLIALWNRTGGGMGDISDTTTFLSLALSDNINSRPTAPSAPISSITVTASPFSYQASIAGQVWINQGTYSFLTLTRGAVTLSLGPVTRGTILLSVGDILTFTYTTLPPTLYFVPL
jgi:hypothetical protein